ncbi:MAG: VOC family protein [Nannocystaceae bacterium]
MTVKYLEIVTNELDSTCALYEQLYGVPFAPRDPTLGQARVAHKPDGTLIGIREPLAEHESPIVRAYLAVDDIEQAAKAAEDGGAMVAYPPTREGEHGVFAIVIKDGVQHGLWQR